MSLKRSRNEQLCPSIDSMISLVFCTLCHYVIVKLNVDENHVQYVHCKTDETPFPPPPPPPAGHTVHSSRDFFFRKHKNCKKNL